MINGIYGAQCYTKIFIIRIIKPWYYILVTSHKKSDYVLYITILTYISDFFNTFFLSFAIFALKFFFFLPKLIYKFFPRKISITFTSSF